LASNKTYSERLWPDTTEFNSVLRSWKAAGSAVLLSLIWKGYDSFRKASLAEINCSHEDESLERDITRLLEPKIREAMSGYEPFYVQHGPYEFETRQPAPAQPPEYDIAFVLRANPRVMWPLEAKVLRTDSDTTNYIDEVKNNFLTCRYSPFSNEAAMLGYLLSGDLNKVFENIASKTGWNLENHPDFIDRAHKVSCHKRNPPKNKAYPPEFSCHHLLFELWVSKSIFN
jgi:hypothetical protein